MFNHVFLLCGVFLKFGTRKSRRAIKLQGKNNSIYKLNSLYAISTILTNILKVSITVSIKLILEVECLEMNIQLFEVLCIMKELEKKRKAQTCINPTPRTKNGIANENIKV
jgi:hypothetical protein